MLGRAIRATLLLTLSVVLVACGGGDSNGADAPAIKIDAKQWSFSPSLITLRKGEPVDLELTSLDVHHRFYVPDFGIDVDVVPNQTTTVHLQPDNAGTFHFRCEYYCGQGHEGMVGQLVVQ